MREGSKEQTCWLGPGEHRERRRGGRAMLGHPLHHLHEHESCVCSLSWAELSLQGVRWPTTLSAGAEFPTPPLVMVLRSHSCYFKSNLKVEDSQPASRGEVAILTGVTASIDTQQRSQHVGMDEDPYWLCQKRRLPREEWIPPTWIVFSKSSSFCVVLGNRCSVSFTASVGVFHRHREGVSEPAGKSLKY